MKEVEKKALTKRKKDTLQKSSASVDRKSCVSWGEKFQYCTALRRKGGKEWRQAQLQRQRGE